MRLALLLAVSACTGISGDPGGGETLATARRPANLAMSGPNVYFVTWADGNYSNYAMHQVPATGGTPVQVAQGGVIFGTAGDETGVYWVGSEGLDVFARALPAGATEPVDLITARPTTASMGTTYRNFILDAQNLYYSDTNGNVWQIAKTGSVPYLIGKTDTSAGSVAMSPDGLWVTTLHGAKLLPSGTEIQFSDVPPDGLAWGDGALFAAFGGTGFADGSIVKVSTAEGPTTIASRLILPGELTVHDAYVYFATGNQDSAIRRVPFAGGGSEALAQGAWPSGIAFDDQYVYFCDEWNDRIRRVPY